MECIDLLTTGLKVNWSTAPKPLTLMVQDIFQVAVQQAHHYCKSVSLILLLLSVHQDHVHRVG